MRLDGLSMTTTAVKVHHFDLSAGKPIRQFGTDADPVRSFSQSADGKALAGWCEKQVCIWDTATGKDLASFPLSTKELYSPAPWYDSRSYVPVLAVSPGGKMLAARGIRHVSDTKYIGWLTVWDSGAANARHHFEWDVKINGWQEWHNREDSGSYPLYDDRNGPLCFSPDGKMLALAFETSIALWDLNKGKETHRITGKGLVSHSMAFSSNGKLIAALADGGCLRFWNTATGALVGQVSNAPTWITQFCFSSDGRIVATACSDATVLLWDIKPILASTPK